MPLVSLALLLSAAPLDARTLPGFVDARAAWALLAAGACVLDARPASAYGKGHLAGARRVDWQQFSDKSRRALGGRLAPDDRALSKLLGELGVRHDRPVLVYGDPLTGWGEEGRIAWTLETLGHPGVHVLDGGLRAWTAAGGTLSREEPPPATGTFPIARQAPTTATVEEVQAARKNAVTLLDTRTREEFEGATWYGVRRGGHIPGARLLPWKQLLDSDGKVQPKEKLRELAGTKGPIITYCTGGVRSAFVYWALKNAGLSDVRNFPGSWWEWSSRDDLSVEGGR